MKKPDDITERSSLSRRSRKRRELALFLPILGAIAFTSPVLDMFGETNATLVLKVVYIFGIWIALILLTLLLSRSLKSEMRNR